MPLRTNYVGQGVAATVLPHFLFRAVASQCRAGHWICFGRVLGLGAPANNEPPCEFKSFIINISKRSHLSVASKGLTVRLSCLDATLTRNPGEGGRNGQQHFGLFRLTLEPIAAGTNDDDP